MYFNHQKLANKNFSKIVGKSMKKTIFLILSKISHSLSDKQLGKIPLLNKIQDLIFGITNPNELIFLKIQDSFFMYLNSNDQGIALPLIKFGIYEGYETRIFKDLISPESTVIDIGANVGYYTLLAASALKNGFVYSFEPVIDNYELLIKNIEVNKFYNVKTFQKAVSNEKKKIKIFIDEKNLGNHSLAGNNVPNNMGFVEVESVTLDSIFNNLSEAIGDNIVIKMDTQGAEGLVVGGADKLLSKKNIKILMEFWPKGLRNMGTDPLGLLNKLQGYGFEIKLINEKTRSLENLTKNDIIEFCYDPKEIIQVNLLLEKGN